MFIEEKTHTLHLICVFGKYCFVR